MLEGESFNLIGFLLSRGLGLTYFLAFFIFYNQYSALVGKNGLDPVDERNTRGWRYFSLFHFVSAIKFIDFSAILGMILSLMVLTGLTELLSIFSTTLVWIALWVLFTSFVNSGGVFTKPGWEIILAEAGFLAIFLGNGYVQTPVLVVLAFRWILFRMMLGSAVTKIRGGDEWKNLGALKHHFESQPFPNPLSWKLHNLPDKFLKCFTALVQAPMIILPFVYFFPQPFAAVAGILTIILQVSIVASGNYAWLNLITSVLALSTLNDDILNLVFGIKHVSALSYPYSNVLTLFMFLLGVLSIKPAANFFSKKPFQNASYNPLHLANSYGAFPKVMENHFEVIIEGKKNGKWKEYKLNTSFRQKDQAPAQIAPYHYMMEYILYFYVNEEIKQEEWIIQLLEKTLCHEEKTLDLYRSIPFNSPPKKIRMKKCRYSFNSVEKLNKTGKYWTREKLETLHLLD